MKRFKTLLKRAGLPKTLTFHGLRHTAITLMLANRVGVPDASAIAGHSSPTVTLGSYGHALPPHTRAAIGTLARVLGQGASSG